MEAAANPFKQHFSIGMAPASKYRRGSHLLRPDAKSRAAINGQTASDVTHSRADLHFGLATSKWDETAAG
jgi:hypothetical protein